jgi:hypothetical protein
VRKFTGLLLYASLSMALLITSGCNFDDSSSNADNPAPAAPAPPDTPPIGGRNNNAPQISGAPANRINVGQAYSFQPQAQDADNDNLSFSVASQPRWALFDTETGKLWGTPTNQDVGVHEEIIVSVTDGKSVSKLPKFGIEVAAVTDGSATLRWQAPVENTDGSTIISLKGYRIHYGTASKQYGKTVMVDNASVTQYRIEELTPGTYYFAVSAVGTNGTESALSREVNKTI